MWPRRSAPSKTNGASTVAARQGEGDLMAARSTFLVGHVRGIAIRIHLTFLLVLPFLAYSFGQRFADAARLASTTPERLVGSPWLWGLAIAVALFASVLVHELAHSLYALGHGGKVRSITLHMVGGMSELTAPPRSEILMALAGPAISLALGGLFVGLAGLTTGRGLPNVSFGLFYLGQLNLVLGLFNLLPAFPMDGGRILRGGLARRMGIVRATRIAARVGRAFALLFALLGFLSLNILLLFVSFIVYVGSESEARDVLLRAALGDVRVRDFMSPVEAIVDAEETLLVLADRMTRERRTAYPVTDAEHVIGFITADAVARVPPEHRAGTLARQAMQPATLVDAGDRLVDALHALGGAGVRQVAVVDAGRLVGTLSRLDVGRGLELRELARPEAGASALRVVR
jgi:Zn-dependent protease